MAYKKVDKIPEKNLRFKKIADDYCEDNDTNYYNVAEKAGISRDTFYSVTDGRREATERVIDKIVKLTKASKVWIMTGEGKPYKSKEEKRTTLTDLAQITAKMDIYRSDIKRMDARMKAYEREVDELKQRVNELEATDKALTKY